MTSAGGARFVDAFDHVLPDVRAAGGWKLNRLAGTPHEVASTGALARGHPSAKLPGDLAAAVDAGRVVDALRDAVLGLVGVVDACGIALAEHRIAGSGGLAGGATR
jgi:hypothetical protein